MVGFLSATTGLRELAVATVHLDSDLHGTQEGLSPLTFPFSALEAGLEPTIWESVALSIYYTLVSEQERRNQQG